jgi:hypothetical protein
MLKNSVFLTFGDGTKGWRDARRRIVKEAVRSKAFEYVFGLSDEWLKNWRMDTYQFILNVENSSGKRGHGYWAWKPTALVWADIMFPSHHIVYVDAGSHLNIKSSTFMNDLEKWAKVSENLGGLAWQLPNNVEKFWTKMELVKFLNPDSDSLESGQVQSGLIMLPPIKKRSALLQDWLDITLSNNGLMINDELQINQIPGFIEHRHDQSIFSLLWKKYEFPLITDESDPILNWKSPIIATRNNTNLPLGLTPSWIIKMVSRINVLFDIFSRLFNKLK